MFFVIFLLFWLIFGHFGLIIPTTNGAVNAPFIFLSRNPCPVTLINQNTGVRCLPIAGASVLPTVLIDPDPARIKSSINASFGKIIASHFGCMYVRFSIIVSFLAAKVRQIFDICKFLPYFFAFLHYFTILPLTSYICPPRRMNTWSSITIFCTPVTCNP